MFANRDFVTGLYRCLLEREPDYEGFRLYVSLLEAGSSTRHDIVHTLLSSTEFSEKSFAGSNLKIEEYFNLAYDRSPTEAEVDTIKVVAKRLGATKARDYLRAVICAFGRYEYPTSIAVRFVQQDLEAVSLAGVDRTIMLDKADLSVSRDVMDGEGHEAHLHAIFKSFVRPGMTAVDVGANVGIHTFKLSELVGNTGKVYSFEPNTENVRILSLAKADCSLANVTVLPFALSRQTGAAFFSPAIGSNGGFMPDEQDTILHPNCIIVPTVRMDLILQGEQVDFIKVDVEGAEYLVLQGAEKILETYRPVITSEFSLEMLSRVSRVHGAEYLRQIMGRGYRAFTLGISGPIVEITNVDQFLTSWGSHLRIEDLVFVPAERKLELADIRASLN